MYLYGGEINFHILISTHKYLVYVAVCSTGCSFAFSFRFLSLISQDSEAFAVVDLARCLPDANIFSIAYLCAGNSFFRVCSSGQSHEKRLFAGQQRCTVLKASITGLNVEFASCFIL